jgi:hypothetical protein
VSTYKNRPPAEYKPGENLPDLIEVPDATISVLTELPIFDELPRRLLEPLAGKKERDWFTEHFYFCLPLTLGNQYGFVVKLLHDIVLRWDGGRSVDSLRVHSFAEGDEENQQVVSSHFGSGILTVQNRFMFRTPKNINLLVCAPPNFLIPGIFSLTAIVETDNLRRDFTYNLKVTIPDRDILIERGTPIGCIIPLMRNFAEEFKIELHPEGEALENERKTMRHFAISRSDYENGLPNHLYRKGKDIYGNSFPVHQRHLISKTPASFFLPLQSDKRFAPESRSPELAIPMPPKDELLDAQEKMFASILAKLKKLNMNYTLEHVTDVTDYIQTLRIRGYQETAIGQQLLSAGWDEQSVKILLSDFQ